MTSIPDAELAELRRLHAAANGHKLRVAHGTGRMETDSSPSGYVGVCVWGSDAESFAALHNAFPALLARLEAAERERDELRRKNAAKEDWLRAWMQYLWDGKPDATARERFIADVESRFMGGEFDSLVWLAARDVQQRREALREAAKEIQGVTDSIVWCDSELQGRQSVIDRLMEMASELEAANGR